MHKMASYNFSEYLELLDSKNVVLTGLIVRVIIEAKYKLILRIRKVNVRQWKSGTLYKLQQ